MNYLKIVSKGWAGYTGQLNIITFRNGVSLEPVPDRIADRIAGSVSVVACDENGVEIEGDARVGIQHRLVTESSKRAELTKPLSRQSEDDKTMESKLDAAAVLKAPVEEAYTREDLEKVADESGIKGLRVIGDKWRVKGRSIPELINDILTAQSTFIAKRNALLEQTGGPSRKHTLQAEEEAAPEAAEEEALVAAAFDGIADSYRGANDFVISGAALVLSALKNSGKSLTGWNALEDKDRKTLIQEEIKALETVYGPLSTDVAEATSVSEAPAEEKPAEGETPADEAGEQASEEDAPKSEGEGA